MDGVVKITAREKIRADNDGDADEILKKLTLTMEQSGNAVFAQAKYEKMLSGFHFGSWPPVQVDFIVTLPASFATDLKDFGAATLTSAIWPTMSAPARPAVTSSWVTSPRRSMPRTSGGNVSLVEGTGSGPASHFGRERLRRPCRRANASSPLRAAISRWTRWKTPCAPPPAAVTCERA